MKSTKRKAINQMTREELLTRRAELRRKGRARQKRKVTVLRVLFEIAYYLFVGFGAFVLFGYGGAVAVATAYLFRLSMIDIDTSKKKNK